MLEYCQNCGEEFQVMRYKQKFCSRHCFKNNYMNKLKEKKSPMFLCPGCKKSIRLDFNPRKERKRWEEYQCPNCGVGKNNKEIIN